MLLAIDAGNTNIVFAVYDGETVRAQWRAVTQRQRTADEYAVWLSQLLALEGLSFADLDAAIIATVVPAALFDLRALCRNYLKCEPLIVGDPAVDLGIKVNVDRPAGGGRRPARATRSPRMQRYKGAVIVVDFGTATNFDIVAREWRFRRQRDRAGRQSFHRGAAPGRGAAAARRHPPRPDRDRHATPCPPCSRASIGAMWA